MSENSVANRETVAVLLGGPSEEQEISLDTGLTVLRHLVEYGFPSIPVLINTSCTFSIQPLIRSDEQLAEFEAVSNSQMGDRISDDVGSLEPLEAIAQLRKDGCDVAWIALHGKFGEDGRVQGMLEEGGLAYTGSGVSACSVAMDKCAFKRVIENEGIPTAPFLVMEWDDWIEDKKRLISTGMDHPGLPAVFKAADQGSSIGIRMVREVSEIVEAADACFELSSSSVLWEGFVGGRELSCATFGGDAVDIEAWPIVEIVPTTSDWFDWEAKYRDGGAEEIVPARIDSAVAEEFAAYSKQIHRLLGCEGMLRTDAIWSEEGELFILETNTHPGLTNASLLPKAAKAQGVAWVDLLQRTIDLALARKDAC